MGRFLSRLLPLLIVLTLLASSAAAWGGWAPAAETPKFAVVPAAQAHEGQGHLDSLRQGATDEGFLDRMFGTNCFSQAVAQLTADCRRMEPEAKTRLALSLMNCQLQVQGGQTFPCHRRQTIKECSEALTDRAHALFVEFLTHTDSMCLHIQNQNFEKYTENMLDRLAEGAGFAREQLAAVGRNMERLGRDSAALQAKAGAALGLLHQHSELGKESLKLQREARQEAATYFESLDAKQQQGLDLQDEALRKQAVLEEGQAATLRMLEEAEGHLGGLFELVEGRAADLAAAAGQQAEAQRQLARELGGLLDSSRGIRSAVDVVIGYQQRSDSVLMRLLGKSYTLEDAAFYAAGLLAAMAAGTSPATARAKLPVMALMCMSLLGERLLLDRLHMLMDMDGAGQIVMNLPLPGWLQLLPSVPTAPLQLNFKATVRGVTTTVAAAMVLFCLASYRDFERESYRLLLQLEEDQRRRHNEYIALINRHKVELAAMLGDAGGGGSGDGPQTTPVAKQRAVAAVGKGAPAAQLAGPGSGGGGQLVLVGAGTTAPAPQGWLVSEEEEVEEEEDQQKEEMQQQGRRSGALAKQLQAQPCAAPAGGVAAGAVTTPPGKAGRRMAASPRPSKPALLCQSAAQRASRKRDASSGDVMDPGAEAGDGPAKRRWTGRRRSSETEEIVTEAMAVDGQDGEKESATQGMMGGQRRGKRARRGSADVAAKPVGAAVPAKRRARR